MLLSSLANPDQIADQFHRCGVNAIQLCEWLDNTSRARLRALLPNAFIMQVVHVTGTEAITKAEHGQNHVDALLLDSGTLSGPSRELGGTGRTHDWTISGQICLRVGLPVFLAGGLQPSNVASAIEAVQPFGVDVCSGVRSNGALDDSKLSAFLGAAVFG